MDSTCHAINVRPTRKDFLDKDNFTHMCPSAKHQRETESKQWQELHFLVGFDTFSVNFVE